VADPAAGDDVLETEPAPEETGDLNSSGVVFGKTLLQFIPPVRARPRQTTAY
jgi:hypothetical protein